MGSDSLFDCIDSHSTNRLRDSLLEVVELNDIHLNVTIEEERIREYRSLNIRLLLIVEGISKTLFSFGVQNVFRGLVRETAGATDAEFGQEVDI